LTIIPEFAIIDLSKQFINHSQGASMSQVERFANEAVYILQLNTRDAVRYIQRNAVCNDDQASTAFRQAIGFSKVARQSTSRA
jgi:hypothetical protein